jgi:hypothetical protein
MAPTVGDLAAICDWCYTPNSNSFTLQDIDGGEWHLISTSAPNSVGFNGYVLGNGDGQIIIAIRGTDNAQNLLEDAMLGTVAPFLQQTNPILNVALPWITSVATEYAGQDQITLTGHSLGGYIAQVATTKLLNGIKPARRSWT